MLLKLIGDGGQFWVAGYQDKNTVEGDLEEWKGLLSNSGVPQCNQVHTTGLNTWLNTNLYVWVRPRK